MQNPKKRPAQTLNRAKTTVVCNLFEFVVRFLQSAPGCFNAQALHEPCRGCTSVLQEHARKVTRTHTGLCGKLFYREVLAQIVVGPGTNRKGSVFGSRKDTPCPTG